MTWLLDSSMWQKMGRVWLERGLTHYLLRCEFAGEQEGGGSLLRGCMCAELLFTAQGGRETGLFVEGRRKECVSRQWIRLGC